MVEFYALHEVVIRGKEVCKHGASKKNALFQALTIGTAIPFYIDPKKEALTV